MKAKEATTIISYAVGENASKTALTTLHCTFAESAGQFAEPPNGDKGGSYFIRCGGTKRTNTDTAPNASLLIIDGDKGVDGGVCPPPHDIHALLKSRNINHVVYSSYTNTPPTPRYRIVLPCAYTREQLPPTLEAFFNILHANGLMLGNSSENATWSQAWYFPRVTTQTAPHYVCLSHTDGVDWVAAVASEPAVSDVPKNPTPNQKNTPTPRTQQTHANTKPLWQKRLDGAIAKGSDGGWHRTRFDVGMVLGGLVAAGECNEIDGLEYVGRWHDDVCTAHNDTHSTRGVEWKAVLDGVHEGKAKPLERHAPCADALSGVDMRAYMDGIAGITGFAVDEGVEAQKRPYYEVVDDGDRAGVWLHTTSKSADGVMENVSFLICSPITATAKTAHYSEPNNGLLLHITANTGGIVEWVMPRSMMARPIDLQGELLKRGATIYPNQELRLKHYLMQCSPADTLHTVDKSGWYGDTFVMPHMSIGARTDMRFRRAAKSAYCTAGTREQWDATIGVWCEGNPLLMFSVCVGLVGALLEPLGLKGVGFHIHGASNAGKSTGMAAALSLWGDTVRLVTTWNTTAAALQGIAVERNDGFLAMDELGSANPKDIANSMYDLGNGEGRGRAGTDGERKESGTWRVAVLSNGERTLEEALAKDRIAMAAGQENRLLHIPIFGAHGAFETLHGMEAGFEMANAISRATKTAYGHTGVAWLEALCNMPEEQKSQLSHRLDNICAPFLELVSVNPRAVKSFAAVALAGELAVELGVIKWAQGAPQAAAFACFKECFDEQITDADGLTKEAIQAMRAITDYIETRGDAEFTHRRDVMATIKGDRSGWWEERDGMKVWLFTSSGLKRALSGLNKKTSLQRLDDAGWLVDGSESGKPYFINNATHRCVAISVKTATQLKPPPPENIY